VKEYLSNYPGLKKEDYPKFEDFDHDNGKLKHESLSLSAFAILFCVGTCMAIEFFFHKLTIF